MIAAFVLFAAAFGGWMLSGSPVPMVFSFLILAIRPLIARISSPEKRLFLSVLSATIAFLTQTHLFQSQQALALRAELPGSYHFSMLLLWCFALFRTQTAWQILIGLSGSLILLGAAANTVLYDFAPWQTYPVLALPLSLITASVLVLKPGRLATASLLTLALTLLASGVLVTSIEVTDRLEARFASKTDEEDSFEDRPIFTKSSSSGLDGAARQIPREGNVVFTGDIKIYLQAKSPELFRRWLSEPLYLRTAVLTRFESDEVLSPFRTGRWLYDSDDDSADSRTEITIHRSDEEGKNYTVFLGSDSAQSLPILPNTNAIFTPAIYEFSDDWYQLSPPEEISFLQFTAAFRQRTSPRRIVPLPAAEADELHLNLPPSPLAGKVRALTRSLTEEDPLVAVQEFLRENVSYTLQFSTPEGMSPIENVLFHDRKGHCEHFASASLLMLRSLGIPSRLAYGYAGGAADKSKQIVAFRDSDFHSWTEILTKDGWVIFDTIPPTADATNREPTIAKVTALDATAYHNFSAIEGGEETSRTLPSLIEIVSFFSDHFLTLVAGAFLLFASAYFLGLGRKRKEFIEETNPGQRQNVEATPPDFLNEIELIGANLGIEKNAGQTWREYLGTLSEKTTLPASFETALDYFYKTEYGHSRKSSDSESRFLLEIRRYRKEQENSAS